MASICRDCGLDAGVVKKCPAHPKREFLGYLQGEGLAWREAGQHSLTGTPVKVDEVVKDVFEFLNRSVNKK